MKTKLFLLLLIIGMILSLIGNPEPQKTDDQTSEALFQNLNQLAAGKKVLQVDLDGAIFYETFGQAGGVNFLVNQINKAAKNDDIKAMFIRANSPGGAVVASQELYEAIKRFQKTDKPIITSIMNLCASGCYYAVLPSETIIANRGSVVGSIGVILGTANFEELAKNIGIKMNNITSAEYKDILSPFRPVKPFEKKHIQSIVDKLHADFVSDVIEWRSKKSSAEIIERTANGLVYTSDQAKERGLIDEIGDIEYAKEVLAKRLKVSVKDITFIKPSYQYWQDIFGIQISSFMNLVWANVGQWWNQVEQDTHIPKFSY